MKKAFFIFPAEETNAVSGNQGFQHFKYFPFLSFPASTSDSSAANISACKILYLLYFFIQFNARNEIPATIVPVSIISDVGDVFIAVSSIFTLVSAEPSSSSYIVDFLMSIFCELLSNSFLVNLLDRIFNPFVY